MILDLPKEFGFQLFSSSTGKERLHDREFRTALPKTLAVEVKQYPQHQE